MIDRVLINGAIKSIKDSMNRVKGSGLIADMSVNHVPITFYGLDGLALREAFDELQKKGFFTINSGQLIITEAGKKWAES